MKPDEKSGIRSGMKNRVDSSCALGAFRPNNEDAIEYGFDDSQPFFWMVAADGMGGHQAGEVASEMMVSSIKTAVSDIKGNYQQDWPSWIKSQLEIANRTIFDEAENNSKKRGMGTTVVLAIIWDRKLYVGWVGDSRAYICRNGKLKLLTRDHSAIHYLLDKGSITEKEALEADSNHLLARAIGSKQFVEVDLITEDLQRGDIMLLSTDGLHDYVPQAILENYLEKFASGQAVSETLVELSIAQGSQDNITLGIVAF